VVAGFVKGLGFSGVRSNVLDPLLYEGEEALGTSGSQLVEGNVGPFVGQGGGPERSYPASTNVASTASFW
jgi:hypothetical protein